MGRTPNPPCERRDLFATLLGGQKFTKLDISHAYHQISLEEEAKKYVTINTVHKLLHKDIMWQWAKTQQAAFEQSKEIIRSPKWLCVTTQGKTSRCLVTHHHLDLVSCCHISSQTELRDP